MEKIFKILRVHLTPKIQMPHIVSSVRLISISNSEQEPVLSKFVVAAPLGQNFETTKTINLSGFKYCCVLFTEYFHQAS